MAQRTQRGLGLSSLQRFERHGNRTLPPLDKPTDQSQWHGAPSYKIERFAASLLQIASYTCPSGQTQRPRLVSMKRTMQPTSQHATPKRESPCNVPLVRRCPMERRRYDLKPGRTLQQSSSQQNSSDQILTCCTSTSMFSKHFTMECLWQEPLCGFSRLSLCQCRCGRSALHGALVA